MFRILISICFAVAVHAATITPPTVPSSAHPTITTTTALPSTSITPDATSTAPDVASTTGSPTTPEPMPGTTTGAPLTFAPVMATFLFDVDHSTAIAVLNNTCYEFHMNHHQVENLENPDKMLALEMLIIAEIALSDHVNEMKHNQLKHLSDEIVEACSNRLVYKL